MKIPKLQNHSEKLMLVFPSRINTMKKKKQMFVGRDPHPKPSEILGNPSSDLHRLSTGSYE